MIANPILDRIPVERTSRHRCSFIDAIAAIASFAGDALAGGGAAAIGGAGAADAAGAAAIGGADLAASAGGAAALGGAADAAGAAGGAGLTAATDLGSLAGGVGGAADLGSAAAGGAGSLSGAGGTAALDTAASVAPAAAPGATAALPGAGAVTSPLTALDTGATSAGDVLSSAAGNVTAQFPFQEELSATAGNIANGTFDQVGGLAATPQDFATAGGVGGSALNAAAPATMALDTAGAAGGALGPATANTALDSAGALGAAGGAGQAASGATSTLSSIMGGLKTAAPLAPLGMLGATLIKGEPPLPPQAQELSGMAGSLSATGQQNLTMAANQQITGAQAAEISTWKQQQLNQLYQLYAKNGVDPNQSSDYLQGVEQINQQAIGMEQQFIDQLVQTGLGETGQAGSDLQAAANMQIQQDTAFNQSIASAIQAFGLTAGLSGLNINLSKAA